jgi:hypothetical protein
MTVELCLGRSVIGVTLKMEVEILTSGTPTVQLCAILVILDLQYLKCGAGEGWKRSVRHIV